MRYIDYKAMKDFYIIAEVCELFEVNMQKLRQYSEQYDVQPQQDQMGRWGFSKVHVRKLHNTIYKAGQKLQIGGKGFEVIGVYAGKYDGKLNTDDQMIVMPYTLQSTMMSVYGMADRQYIVKAADKDVIAELIDELLPGFMQGRCEAGNGYFSASSDSQWQEQSESSNNMLALLGGGVAGISLLVGGIGIMNIMLVSVTERTREIGIRMAIGARKRDIIGQFLVEASVVSCCGGVIGIVLGCFLSAVLGNLLLAKTQNSYMPTVEQFTVLPSAGLVIGAFLFSALLGIIFGLYPANKASNLQPVDALRTQ